MAKQRFLKYNLIQKFEYQKSLKPGKTIFLFYKYIN